MRVAEAKVEGLYDKMTEGYEDREHEGREVRPGGLIKRKRKQSTARPAEKTTTEK